MLGQVSLGLRQSDAFPLLRTVKMTRAPARDVVHPPLPPAWNRRRQRALQVVRHHGSVPIPDAAQLSLRGVVQINAQINNRKALVAAQEQCGGVLPLRLATGITSGFSGSAKPRIPEALSLITLCSTPVSRVSETPAVSSVPNTRQCNAASRFVLSPRLRDAANTQLKHPKSAKL